jgi:dipeptidyl aminopeptidase/acylaminoacyl peptidase
MKSCRISLTRFLVIGASFLSGLAMFSSEAQVRPVTARDCVNVKYITGSDLRGPLVISPDSSHVLYEVKAPDIAEDKNVFELYIKDLHQGREDGNGKLIARGESFGGLHWTKDGSHVLMLERDRNIVEIKNVDVASNAESIFFRAPSSILEYTLNQDEDTIVYSTVYRNSVAAPSANARSADNVFSKLITVDSLFGDPEGVKRALFISKRDADGKWTDPKQITIEDPFTRHQSSAFGELQHLSLSPDGSRLIFAYDAEDLPESWKSHPYVKLVLKNGSPAIITVMYDLSSRKTTIPIKSVYAGTIPFWTNDSQAFVMTAPAPIDSLWEKRDIEEKRISGLDANLYWINVKTGEIQEIMARVPFHHQPPLAWTPDGDLVVKTYGGTISTFHHGSNSWRKVSSVTIPFKRAYPFSQLISDGNIVVGAYEEAIIPPNLYTFDLKTAKTEIITNLNPQLADVTLAKVVPIRWYTSDGMEIHGLLLLPTNYVPARRYPLVIQTKGQQDKSSFACDSGVNHDPAFAPQPIANSGMMYLTRTFPENYDQEKEIARRQASKYPAGVAEAVQQMDIWESGIKSLSAKGLIDPSKVGIIGFSRTGWYVEFMLTHSSFHFAAASVADNVEYSLGEYWLLHDASVGYDNIYGGSPYGPALKNWIKYSISFNLDKVHTPLLMELMGHGVNDNVPGQIPPALAAKHETLVGLQKLKRPVQLYFFPNQGHQPDAPEARLESLQQNIDWFRFWLQGYEDSDPAKAKQYARWRLLRKEQEDEHFVP